MAVSAYQVEEWSTLPDATRSADAYRHVKNMYQNSAVLRRYGDEPYLQGSYANYTNIRTDSDVDVVIELTSSFRSSLNLLDNDEQERFDSAFETASTTYEQFRDHTYRAAIQYFYPSDVTWGGKCLKVAARGRRLPIDILVCQEHRTWISFRSEQESRYISGVIFTTRDGRRVVNYPKLHRENGSIKNSNCLEMYKPIVRAFKAARAELYKNGLLERSIAPSYFVECLLYNIPKENYRKSDLLSAYIACISWLLDNIEDLDELYCQNELQRLFGSTPEQWSVSDAQTLIREVARQAVK